MKFSLTQKAFLLCGILYAGSAVAQNHPGGSFRTMPNSITVQNLTSQYLLLEAPVHHPYMGYDGHQYTFRNGCSVLIPPGKKLNTSGCLNAVFDSFTVHYVNAQSQKIKVGGIGTVCQGGNSSPTSSAFHPMCCTVKGKTLMGHRNCPNNNSSVTNRNASILNASVIVQSGQNCQIQYSAATSSPCTPENPCNACGLYPE